MITREMLLEGLGCASCAAKIETAVNKLAEVDSASVDFITTKLIVKTDAAVDLSALSKKVTEIVHRLEPDVNIIFPAEVSALELKNTELLSKGTFEANNIHKQQITRLALGAAFFTGGLIVPLPAALELAFFLISYIIAGRTVIIRAIKGIVKGQVFSEHFLMSLATIGALIVSEYAEAAAVMLFYMAGEFFQDLAVDHSRKSISSLLDIKPDYANLVSGSGFSKVSPEDVKIGDRIVVKPGERVPLDGKITAGSAFVDTSALTGESMPRNVEPGNAALSGFVNLNGVLEIEVTKVYAESTVARILDLVQNAASKKPPTEQFMTKFARYYTPFVVFAAASIAVLPPLLIPEAVFTDWLYRALVFLVISCPCALVISIPLGFFGGIGASSKRGILVKGGNYLEALNDVDTVVFDKTGTLTQGIFEVTDIIATNGFSRTELLRYAAYAESYSNHPIALSILNSFDAEVDQTMISDYQEIAGKGIKTRIDGKEILVGNSNLLAGEGVEFTENETLGTIVYIAIDKMYAGNIVIADEIKPDARQVIKELKSLGITKTIMLTGDLKSAAESIGHRLGLDEVHAELLPADKVAVFEQLQSQKTRKNKLAYVGDGINDAPVLARSDIGIAMGALGSDAAITAADIVIMNDKTSRIPEAIRIARRTRRIVYQNIIVALGIKAVFLVLGALGIAEMWEAVFADVGVTIIAVLNSMRALKA